MRGQTAVTSTACVCAVWVGSSWASFNIPLSRWQITLFLLRLTTARVRTACDKTSCIIISGSQTYQMCLAVMTHRMLHGRGMHPLDIGGDDLISAHDCRSCDADEENVRHQAPNAHKAQHKLSRVQKKGPLFMGVDSCLLRTLRSSIPVYCLQPVTQGSFGHPPQFNVPSTPTAQKSHASCAM